MNHRLPLPIFLAGLLVTQANCAPSLPPLDPSTTLASRAEFDSSRAFQKILLLVPGTSAYELARINYLLERVSKSPYNFIRNNGRYSGKRGAVHLKWKYYFRGGRSVKTAEEFIDRVATFSKRSGDPYLMEFPTRKRYPLRDLLLRELRELDKELLVRRAQRAQRADETASSTSTIPQ